MFCVVCKTEKPLGSNMKKERNDTLLYKAILLAVLFFIGACRKNGTQNVVVLYCSVDQTAAEPVIAEFEKISGIKVLTRFDSEASKTVGLVQKIRAEAGRPAADVFWSNEIFHTIRLKNEGLLSPFAGEQTKNWPGLSDANGCWYGFALRARVIAYNNKKIRDSQAPKTLEQLLDSKWQGKIVMADPGFGTTGGDVASWFAYYGQARATEILKSLAANKVKLVEGNSTAVRMVASGQADICLTDTDDVYAAVRNGWPVAMNYSDVNSAGCLAIPNTAAIVKGAPHRLQAEKLMQFLLSERCEEILVQSDSHNTPIHNKLARKYQQYEIGKALKLDYEKIAEQLPDAIRLAREILK
jgi:iron(III) transport system substrate-binding protein